MFEKDIYGLKTTFEFFKKIFLLSLIKPLNKNVLMCFKTDFKKREPYTHISTLGKNAMFSINVF